MKGETLASVSLLAKPPSTEMFVELPKEEVEQLLIISNRFDNRVPT